MWYLAVSSALEFLLWWCHKFHSFYILYDYCITYLEVLCHVNLVHICRHMLSKKKSMLPQSSSQN